MGWPATGDALGLAGMGVSVGSSGADPKAAGEFAGEAARVAVGTAGAGELQDAHNERQTASATALRFGLTVGPLAGIVRSVDSVQVVAADLRTPQESVRGGLLTPRD
jgi:hypothetical protein